MQSDQLLMEFFKGKVEVDGAPVQVGTAGQTGLQLLPPNHLKREPMHNDLLLVKFFKGKVVAMRAKSTRA